MSTVIHKAQSLEEALQMLAREKPTTLPLYRRNLPETTQDDEIEWVDLEHLELFSILKQGNQIQVGINAQLQNLATCEDIQATVREALQTEIERTNRPEKSLGELIFYATGASIALTALLGLDAQLVVMPGDEKIYLGDWLPLRERRMAGRLVREVKLPASATLRHDTIFSQSEDRSPLNFVVAKWPSGRTRVAVGGCTQVPFVAFDGPNSGGASEAAADACSYVTDADTTAGTRETIGLIINRLLE